MYLFSFIWLVVIEALKQSMIISLLLSPLCCFWEKKYWSFNYLIRRKESDDLQWYRHYHFILSLYIHATYSMWNVVHSFSQSSWINLHLWSTSSITSYLNNFIIHYYFWDLALLLLTSRWEQATKPRQNFTSCSRWVAIASSTGWVKRERQRVRDGTGGQRET